MWMEGGKTIFFGSRRGLLLGKWGGGAMLWEGNINVRWYERGLLFGKED